LFYALPDDGPVTPSTSRSYRTLTCHYDFNKVCVFVGLHYNNCIIMHGMENAKLITVCVAQTMALTCKMMTVANSFWIILPRHTI